MHMADALISPAVGAAMWVASGALLAHSARKLEDEKRLELVPMMGVLGAFVFASQMINFTIPATGSSGHLGGALLLAILLGRQAAFIVIASVLTVQALFFADGGLLALGCNIFNLGFFPAYVAYPLYRLLGQGEHVGRRAWMAALIAAVVGLQLGAFSVVLETRVSGISDLPFGAFLLLMQPIHLAIGIVEGLVTAVVVSFVVSARPTGLALPAGRVRWAGARPVLVSLWFAALLVGGGLSWFASSQPDGLEWAIAGLTGSTEPVAADSAVHRSLAEIQQHTAILPDYGFSPDGGELEEETWPAVSAGTSVSGIVGGFMTLLLASLCGYALRVRARQT